MYQEIYINLDDSGKLSKKEKISVYGGLVFTSKKEKDKFITQYRSIIENIKCKYCRSNKDTCLNKCPEIKNTNVLNKDKRRVMNYIKKYYVVGLIIENAKVYEPILENKGAKGRFLDYSLRRMIKEIIKDFIKNKSINPNKPIRLIINIDEQPTKNNGYYNLRDGLIEELKYGISNYNYSQIITPILFSNLKVVLKYQDSKHSYAVQAADLLAGTIRQNAIIDSIQDLKSLLNFKLILP